MCSFDRSRQGASECKVDAQRAEEKGCTCPDPVPLAPRRATLQVCRGFPRGRDRQQLPGLRIAADV